MVVWCGVNGLSSIFPKHIVRQVSVLLFILFFQSSRRQNAWWSTESNQFRPPTISNLNQIHRCIDTVQWKYLGTTVCCFDIHMYSSLRPWQQLVWHFTVLAGEEAAAESRTSCFSAIQAIVEHVVVSVSYCLAKLELKLNLEFKFKVELKLKLEHNFFIFFLFAFV